MNVQYLAARVLALATCLSLTPASPGKYRQEDIQQVPVERLVTNLEKAVKKNPMDVTGLVNLARVHAMAYSLKTDTAWVRRGKEEMGPWFNYEAKLVPFSKVEKTEDATKQKEAKAHLAKAIERYKEAVKLAPDNLPARLGYAWTLEQSGEKKEAVKEYRALIEDAWKKEKDLKHLGLGGHTGYDALASLDDNGDGVLTGNELKCLAIWHDANGNGICDPGEVKPLSAYGIMAVSCRFVRDPIHPDHIAFSPNGVTFRNGKTRPTFDIILKPRDGK